MIRGILSLILACKNIPQQQHQMLDVKHVTIMERLMKMREFVEKILLLLLFLGECLSIWDKNKRKLYCLLDRVGVS